MARDPSSHFRFKNSPSFCSKARPAAKLQCAAAVWVDDMFPLLLICFNFIQCVGVALVNEGIQVHSSTSSVNCISCSAPEAKSPSITVNLAPAPFSTFAVPRPPSPNNHRAVVSIHEFLCVGWSCSFICCFQLYFPREWNHVVLDFAHHTLLSVTVSRSVHVVAHGSISSLLTAETDDWIRKMWSRHTIEYYSRSCLPRLCPTAQSGGKLNGQIR